jgi:hypothetical protein
MARELTLVEIVLCFCILDRENSVEAFCFVAYRGCLGTRSLTTDPKTIKKGVPLA